jgi:DNA-binding IclR family transcriptional regulator
MSTGICAISASTTEIRDFNLGRRGAANKNSLPRSGKIVYRRRMVGDEARRDTGLHSVRNAARLLREFTGDRRELGVTEVARRLGISTSTAFRLLTTLTEERLLERADAGGRYRLGMTVYELGMAVFPHTGLHEAAVPVLANLRHVTGETVQLAVLDHLEVVFVERLESPQTLRYVAGVGHRIPAHASSTGKVLLAFLPPDVLAARLTDWEPVRLTRHTIVNKAALLTDLRRVAERGWAQNVEEGTLGAVSVGTPIRDASGDVVAALSVVLPVGRASRQAVRRCVAAAVEAAAAISGRLRPPGPRL